MSVRVRFAPSPTGALHIGGVRTALYNYLFAKKHHGTFILRIEDTDQNRLVEGAEDYIMNSLKWVDLVPEEGPEAGGSYGPYRQSERLDIYKKYAEQLVTDGKAYLAFDSQEALEDARSKAEAGGGAFLYSAANRMQMQNSLSLAEYEVDQMRADGVPYTIRLKVAADEEVKFYDLIRGDVSFQTSGLDDKVLMKADGFPTYHLANIIDDHLMKITHVIRGEEWLSSTAHHILLYKAFGWEETMPGFAHLPLILKPSGNGKLSKRDGDKLGIPVFPLTWERAGADTFHGFREAGFLPEACINFLALLGWNPGTDQEIMSREELIDLFSLEKIGKSGSRFDFDKAKWFNHQYIMNSSSQDLYYLAGGAFTEAGYSFDEQTLLSVIDLIKDRVTNTNDFVSMGKYFFEKPSEFELDVISKKWNSQVGDTLRTISRNLQEIGNFDAPAIESAIKEEVTRSEMSFGQIFPPLRVALTGLSKGPDLFKTIELIGKEEALIRLNSGIDMFENSNNLKS